MKTLKTFLISILACLSFGAFAAGTVTSTISTMQTNPSGLIVIKFVGASTGQPSCATSAGYALQGGTTATGPAVAQLTAAALATLTVNMYGTGACTIISGWEDISTFTVNN